MLFPCLEYSLCLSSELPMALRTESEPLNLAYTPYMSWVPKCFSISKSRSLPLPIKLQPHWLSFRLPSK